MSVQTAKNATHLAVVSMMKILDMNVKLAI
jgi:hypothetical protein